MNDNLQVRGTLTKHRGLWRVVLSYYDENGNRKQKTYSTGLKVENNKRKADAILQEKLDEFKKNLSIFQKSKEDVVLNDVLDKYLEIKKTQINSVTFTGYMYTAKRIKNFFKDTLVKDITIKDIDRFCEHLSKTVGNRTMIATKNLLSNTLDMAVKYEMITNNPTKLAEKYKSSKESNQNKRIIYPEDVLSFLDKLKDEPLYPMIVLTLYYGLRRGEVCGLTWDCVDFEKRKIYIKQTLANNGKDIVFRDYCKTKSSQRICTMTDDIYNLLLDIKKQDDLLKELIPDNFDKNHDYVFVTKFGKRRSPHGVTTLYRYALKKNKIEASRFHDLRHSSATLMFENGASVQQVQHALGHSSSNTTLEVYIHYLDNENKKTAEIMSDVIKF